jgi:hypothetical protein
LVAEPGRADHTHDADRDRRPVARRKSSRKKPGVNGFRFRQPDDHGVADPEAGLAHEPWGDHGLVGQGRVGQPTFEDHRPFHGAHHLVVGGRKI